MSARDTGAGQRPLSLYFHIPFCNTICYYCACNKIITKDHSLSARYVDYLSREMALQAEALPGAREVVQMHFGGGTPTFLLPEEMSRLMAEIRKHFVFQPDGEYSIEVDPRKVSRERVFQLAAEGFNRMSVGIQDFDPQVQRAVNRIQSEDETRQVIEAARAAGFRSVSIDLIYGLPHQNAERFGKTLDRVLAMAPERLALYNYAHLPTRFMPQRRIHEADLPVPEEKLRILAQAIERLTQEGYVYIGMDHFARPDDELAVAQREHALQRNFQGYSTHAECEMLAFGISAIAKFGNGFSQNQRELEPYYEALDKGELPVMRGWHISADEALRNTAIQRLMCDFSLSFDAIDQAHGIEFTNYFATELAELQVLADAGLLSLSPRGLQVTPAGRMLVRVIAMCFDAHLRLDREKRRYSRVI
ncbi:MAG: oxygen-independent coproporphyrinogen III oxidase [Candidatus Dactylopiibacterium carminicum]|nr:MAG: oxygen-independent coproporphyrinogen III oxidase [Candidatus Dactylopiibacterium carminicum]